MPSPNTLKTYYENAYFHIYNRGVEKRTIFQDREDYTRFLYFLKIYLSPADDVYKEFPLLRSYILNNNLSEQIDLLAFCLMPNHFHLLVHQKSKDAITKLMRQVMTSYSTYFNRRHERVGALFQSVFKAAPVEGDQYLLHLSRYIHLNPISRGISLDEFEWSSYLYYLGKRDAKWLNTEIISEYFNNSKKEFSYKSFVEDYLEPMELPTNLAIDSDS